MSDNEYPDEYLDENGNEYQEEKPEQERGELKPCPFCGSKNTTLDYFEISCPQELGTLVLCGDCGSYSTVDRWNTRPIEDALNKRIAELRDVIGDYRNDVSRVLDEKCPSDERHCGCVPILRDQLNKYQKALILITTMPELSQATIAREALQERGKFIWTEQSVGEYWVTKLDEAADVFSRQIIELESRIAELEAERRWIPVGERLPEEKQSVLALDRTGTAYHWEYSKCLSNIFVGYYTHWMPLPELPEEVK